MSKNLEKLLTEKEKVAFILTPEDELVEIRGCFKDSTDWCTKQDDSCSKKGTCGSKCLANRGT